MSDDTLMTTTAPASGVRAFPYGRLSVTGQVYFQPGDGGADAIAVGDAWYRYLSSDEQPYGPRHLSVGESWTALDHGWLDRAGYLVLANRGRKPVTVRPTEDEERDLAAAVLEVGIVPPEPADEGKRTMFSPERPSQEPVLIGPVYPGEEWRLNPDEQVGRLRIRCRKGQTRVAVTVFPA